MTLSQKDVPEIYLLKIFSICSPQIWGIVILHFWSLYNEGDKSDFLKILNFSAKFTFVHSYKEVNGPCFCDF